MNGGIVGNGVVSGNAGMEGNLGGGGPFNAPSETQPLEQIKKALEIVYDVRSSNEARKEAGVFLEHAKNDKEAPAHGFRLAINRSHDPIVRHYALSLLEHGIKYSWDGYSAEQGISVRGWVLTLAENVDNADPVFLRNKVAQLWVEVAKKSWAAEWLDMDALLLKLWAGTNAQRDLCLYILETLVDDVFNREDSAAGIRNAPLSKACIDVFTPAAVLQENFPGREPTPVVRCGEDGWLVRLVDLLSMCLNQGIENLEAKGCASKVLSTLKVSMGWCIPKAITAAKVVDNVGRALTMQSNGIQMLATECLHTLFTRPFMADEDFEAIVGPMYNANIVSLLSEIYNWRPVDANDIDEERYMFLKRFSEMIANLGSAIEERWEVVYKTADLPGFMKLLFEIARHESLAVSIPVMTTWVRIMRKETLSESEAVMPLIPGLLELCTARLIHYESLPENANASLLFLNEDLDTIPERHAFLGNYRRFCSSIVESMVRKRPMDAFAFILSRVDAFLNELEKEQPAFQLENYDKNNIFFLKLDAQFTVVEAALKGYMKWLDHAQDPGVDNTRVELEILLERWCETLIKRSFADPQIQKRVITLLVTFSTSALDRKADLMLKILEHVLLTQAPDLPQYPAYNDAIKLLQTVCTTEIQRLAVKMPDHLMMVYNQLKGKIDEIIASGKCDDRQILAYHTFLFTINHRTRNIDHVVRQERLNSYIVPLSNAWGSAELTASLASFESFCKLLGLDKVQEYMINNRVHEIKDFSAHQLDPQALQLQADLQEKFRVLPIRGTKAFITCSTEKLKKGSAAYVTACNIWHDTIPIILPNLLKFITHAHAFHNPTNWGNLPPEFQPVIKKVLTDRFWQAGISTGSRDQFYENVSKTKTTMEGLASSIRGAIRMVRECCYSILWCMSRLDIHFFGIHELPGPLAHALFADAHVLSSHQMSILLNMTRYIIDDCPPNYREHFLTPLLATLFTQVDRKISSEWQVLLDRAQMALGEDKLAEEMKEESILRQLTYIAVLIVASLVDPAKTADVAGHGQYLPGVTEVEPPRTDQGMREFVLSSDAVLEPLILFCTHALRMRDSRCCGIIIRVFRSIVPEFTEERADIREFICREVLMAAINSLHDDYFVDVQKELAQLIATIFILYSPTSTTPRSLLLSLPGITEEKVDTVSAKLLNCTSTRIQRALILDLLDSLRGVAISEKGKVNPKSRIQERKQMSQQQQQYHQRQETPDLGGVADMFA
ncbi:armadillo-type protein [Kalaharituber pfeilii]|nr:armadillo-type protein [Kalaharituber pfeilii]